MDDREFNMLLDHFGFSRDGYRKVRRGVKKRLRRHMERMGCRRPASYLDAIERDPAARAECLRLLTVPISRVLRDAPLWEALADAILPVLAGRFGLPLRAWSAGCAGGEEVCSLTIAADRFRRAHRVSGAVLAILATDRNPASLARARQACYPSSSLREVPPALRARYFNSRRGGRRWQFTPCDAADVVWQCQSLETADACADIHLLCLRNSVLTYYAEPRRSRLVEKVVRRLAPGGVLAVGRCETMPSGITGLSPWSERLPFVFLRRLAANPCRW